MQSNNLTWEQIKELAEMAMNNGDDFTLDITAEGDTHIYIEKLTPLNTGITISPSTPTYKEYKDWINCKDNCIEGEGINITC